MSWVGLEIDFGDAVAEVIALLKATFTERTITASVGSKLPTDSTVLPYVMVAEGGAPEMRDGIFETVTVRVVVWSTDEDAARDLAKTCRGVLLNGHHGQMISVQPGNGLSLGIDDDLPSNPYTYALTVNTTMRGRIAATA